MTYGCKKLVQNIKSIGAEAMDLDVGSSTGAKAKNRHDFLEPPSIRS